MAAISSLTTGCVTYSFLTETTTDAAGVTTKTLTKSPWPYVCSPVLLAYDVATSPIQLLAVATKGMNPDEVERLNGSIGSAASAAVSSSRNRSVTASSSLSAPYDLKQTSPGGVSAGGQQGGGVGQHPSSSGISGTGTPHGSASGSPDIQIGGIHPKTLGMVTPVVMDNGQLAMYNSSEQKVSVEYRLVYSDSVARNLGKKFTDFHAVISAKSRYLTIYNKREAVLIVLTVR